MGIFSTKTEKEDKQETVVAASQPIVSSKPLAYAPVVIQPRISEKAGALVKHNQYVFRVKLTANKVEVKKAVERAYRVKVTGVNIVRMSGKKRNYGKTSGRTSSFKKAIVTLKQGDKIEGLTDVV